MDACMYLHNACDTGRFMCSVYVEYLNTCHVWSTCGRYVYSVCRCVSVYVQCALDLKHALYVDACGLCPICGGSVCGGCVCVCTPCGPFVERLLYVENLPEVAAVST